MKKLQMLIVSIGLLLCTILTGCTTFQVQTATDTGATDIPLVNMPNPASVYCEQHGNTLEIRTADDGSQSGVCVFPDGNTCDEWAYFQGECGIAATVTPQPVTTADGTSNASGGYMPPGTTEEFADWWGVIKSTPSGAQYDDYFERQDLGQQYIYFGIDSMEPLVTAQIEALRDSGKIVHLYGTLFSNVPDYNGSQILVDRVEIVE
jgi:putative hemolysin